MDLITIIEKYIELSIRRDNLKNTIEYSKSDYYYAKVEGDMAFHNGDYRLEKGYNDCARDYIKTQQKAEEELSRVEQILKFTHQAYIEAVTSIDAIQLREVAVVMSVKKDDVERKIEELSQRRNWAISRGDAAFSSHNYNEELEYNRISSECYMEMEKNKPLLHYYQSFANDLSYRANKNAEQGFGSKRSS